MSISGFDIVKSVNSFKMTGTGGMSYVVATADAPAAMNGVVVVSVSYFNILKSWFVNHSHLPAKFSQLLHSERAKHCLGPQLCHLVSTLMRSKSYAYFLNFHSSSMIECQSNYITSCIRTLIEANGKSIDCR